MIRRLINAYRAWKAKQDEFQRLIDLGEDIVKSGRKPVTEEEVRAVEAFEESEERII